MSNPEEGHQSEAGHPPQSQDQSQGGGAGGGTGTGEAGTMDRQQQQQQEQAQEINHHQQQDSRNPGQEEDEEQEGEHGSANGHQHANATTGPSDQEEPEQKRKLFLGGLDYGTREEALREYFSTFGTLKDVVVMRFPDTKRSRGFGFVTFATSQEANQCFQAKPHTIDGVVIETKRATPREEAGGPGGGRRGRRSEHDDDDEGLDGDQRPPGKEPECQRKLFIGGLDYGTSDEGLRDYFSQFGQIVDSVVMKFRDTKRSRGFGFVTYATAAMVDECQARRPHTLDGTKIEVKRATPREEVDRGDDGQTVNKVFVGGLSDAITDDVLREYFSQFGHVVSAEHRVVKSTGKKRGFGFVEFDDYDPVDKLLLKPRHMLKGRRLDVKRAVSKSEMHMRDEPRGERDDYRYHRDRPPAPWAGGRQPGYDSRGGYARGGADRDAFGPGPFGPREVSSPWDRPARAQPSPWQSAGGGSAGGAGGNSWEGQAGGWGQSAATPWMDDGYGPPREARGGGGSSYGGGSAYGGGGGSAYGGGSSYGAGSSYGGGGYGGDSMAGGASRDAGGPMRNNFGSYYNRNAAPYDRNGRGGSRPAAPVEGGGYGYMSGGSAGGAGGGGARW